MLDCVTSATATELLHSEQVVAVVVVERQILFPVVGDAVLVVEDALLATPPSAVDVGRADRRVVGNKHADGALPVVDVDRRQSDLVEELAVTIAQTRVFEVLDVAPVEVAVVRAEVIHLP